MKQYFTLFVLLAFIFSGNGCAFQPSHVPTNPSLDWGMSRDMAKPVALISIFGLSILATAAVFKIIEQQKEQRLFQRLGRYVPYMMHEEAPTGARLLGEVECWEYSQIEVKNNLRTQAARMGGNLLVIDVLSESRRQNNVLTYSGSGRVYWVKRTKNESH